MTFVLVGFCRSGRQGHLQGTAPPSGSGACGRDQELLVFLGMPDSFKSRKVEGSTRVSVAAEFRHRDCLGGERAGLPICPGDPSKGSQGARWRRTGQRPLPCRPTGPCMLPRCLGRCLSALPQPWPEPGSGHFQFPAAFPRRGTGSTGRAGLPSAGVATCGFTVSFLGPSPPPAAAHQLPPRLPTEVVHVGRPLSHPQGLGTHLPPLRPPEPQHGGLRLFVKLVASVLALRSLWDQPAEGRSTLLLAQASGKRGLSPPRWEAEPSWGRWTAHRSASQLVELLQTHRALGPIPSNTRTKEVRNSLCCATVSCLLALPEESLQESPPPPGQLPGIAQRHQGNLRPSVPPFVFPYCPPPVCPSPPCWRPETEAAGVGASGVPSLPHLAPPGQL